MSPLSALQVLAVSSIWKMGTEAGDINAFRVLRIDTGDARPHW